MNPEREIIIIGGGLAGLSAAIHLSNAGRKVTLFEKTGYPRHKVCGEYVSNEIMPYLEWLGVNISGLNPVKINNFRFSTLSGKAINSKLPMGGFGLSRYVLDELLYKKALKNGCEVIEAQVTEIDFSNEMFTVTANDTSYTTKVVLGAYGKRSGLDQKMGRSFFRKKSEWLAVKAHYKGDLPDDTVALHNFKGGYCGVSKVEGDKINVCYLADFKTFKAYKNIEEYQNKVLSGNAALKALFENCEMVFDKPITISQISFEPKKTIENHILMTGDTAGLIHPLCGNGMAMAIHSAKIASEAVLDFLSGTLSRTAMERQYTREWKKQFGKRMRMGRMLSALFRHQKLTTLTLDVISKIPSVITMLIKQTHGTPIPINN